jgi:hypothetical protein
MVVILYREAIEYFSSAISSSELDLSLLSGIAGPLHSFFWLQENGFEATLAELGPEAW